MEIIDKRNGKTEMFGYLDLGDTFIDEDGDYTMKVEETGGLNGVNLRDGQMYHYSDYAEVVPVKTQLVVLD